MKIKIATHILRGDFYLHVCISFHCGVFGNPYSGISVQDTSFTIVHYGGSMWRWSRVITFQYNKNSEKYLFLEDTGEPFHATEPDKTESQTYDNDFLNKVEFENYKSNW